MSEEPIVYGIKADLANEFSPQQWVNLYQLDPVLGEEKLHFLRKCQVKELCNILANASFSDFAVEPLDEQGNVISVQQALDNSI